MGDIEKEQLKWWIRKHLDDINDRFESAHPDDILEWGMQYFGSSMVLGTGFGPSGIFLIHRLTQLGYATPIFFLDTQLLFDETYELKERLEDQFGLNITRVTPDLSLDEQAEKFGDKLWNRNPNRCCHLRKVLPLRNYLSDKRAWITGVRRDQSQSRRTTKWVEWDPGNRVVKINPVAGWTREEVWEYIHEHNLPYNPLHDDGYPSIGCIPCTSMVNAGEEERAGRWSGMEKTECGIHLPSQDFEQELK